MVPEPRWSFVGWNCNITAESAGSLLMLNQQDCQKSFCGNGFRSGPQIHFDIQCSVSAYFIHS